MSHVYVQIDRNKKAITLVGGNAQETTKSWS